MQSKTFKNFFQLLLILFCFVIYYHLTSEYNFIQDDSYISFRYADNFVNGNGLVFNLGERVEGFTSFFWIMLLSIIKLLNLDLEFWSQVLSFSFGLGVITTTYFIAKILLPSSGNIIFDLILFTLPSYLIAISGGFAYWSISGMETTLFILLLMFGFLFLLKSRENTKSNYIATTFFLLSALTRPEGYYFLLVYFVYRFFIIRKHTVSIKPIIGREIVFAFIPFLLFFLFRLIYYGYPLPNTFYAKAGISQFFLRRGFEYFLEFAKANLLYGVLFVVPIILLFDFKKYSAQLWLWGISFTYIVAIILIGGDVLPFHRLFLPVLPIIYILFVASAVYLTSYLGNVFQKNIVTSVIILAVLFIGYINFKNEQPKLNDIHATELGLVYKMKIYAKWVNEQQKDNNNVTVALSTIGAFSYFSNTRIIDLLGLTNEYIAHNPAEMKGISEPATRNWVERTYNAEYVLSQKPDYIIFPAGAKPSAFPESALFISPIFKELYYPQLIQTEKLSELITVYTLRTNNSEMYVPRINPRCEENASVNFINATNLFLRYSKTHDSSLIPRINVKADSALILCPLNKDDVLELKGMLYYFEGEPNKAKHLFNEAIKIDSMNSFSYLYLINIYNKQDSLSKSLRYLRKLKKLSPSLYPQFHLN